MFHLKSFIGLLGHAGFVAIQLVISQPVLGHDHNGPAKGEAGPFARQAESPSSAYIESEPPLWDKLGTLSYKVTTTSDLAQKYFDQGLRLTYAFNHAEARRAFRKAQQLDPACTLCYWGEALVLGPNINAPMEHSALAPALVALAKAKEVSASASEKERALIEALAARYSEDPKAERKALDAAYAEAMGKIAAHFPEDQEIAVFYAESLMDLSPWDYWEAGGSRPKGRTAEIIKVLERVLAKNLDHPGAIHYYIHIVEASDNPKRAEPYADRLNALMPGAGHLVHMPSHIYYRIGRYRDSLTANKVAVAVDEAYLAQVQAQGIYPQAYYPHAVHMLLVSAQMAGDGKTAIETAQKLARVISREAARSIPFVQPIKAAPYFTHVQFSSPETVLALDDPGDEFPYVKAMWHYAHGVAYAAQGRIEAARAQARAITEIGEKAKLANLIAGGVPAKEVLAIARYIVAARIAQAQGDLKAAAAEFEAAVALEDKLAYMEPPYWYYPVRQSLGAMLLLLDDLDQAEQAFRASLTHAPNNGWALYGLVEVYKRRGDEQKVNVTERLLTQAWVGDRSQLNLAQL